MKSIDVVAFGTCYVDINLDSYPFGSEGISPETELVGGSYELTPGGSAVNFCKLLGSLGLDAAFIGMAGNDNYAAILEDRLCDSHVTPHLVKRDDLQTSISFNMTNPKGQHIMLVGGTANAALGPTEVLPRLTERSSDTKIVYMGGCFKLKAFQHAFSEVVSLCNEHSLDLVIDHGRIPDGTPNEMKDAVKALVIGAAYYFPSKKEFCELWQVATIEEGLTQLSLSAPNLTVIVKDGANGAYFWANNSLQHVPGQHVDTVVNATGAGDTFNAGVIKSILNDDSLYDAVDYGCKIAAAKISGQG